MRVILVLVGIGVGLLWVGYEELSMRNAADDEPQELTLAELAANGPGDNAHVRVGDFFLCEFSYIYEERYGQWTTVWIPAVPLGGEYHRKLQSLVDENGTIQGDLPLPKDVRVIVKDTGALNEEKVSELAARDTFQGLVVNKIESLSSEERRMLQESYPGVDFDRCWIVHEGRQPAGTGKLATLLGGGFGSLALGGFLLITARARKPRNPSVSSTPASVQATEPEQVTA